MRARLSADPTRARAIAVIAVLACSAAGCQRRIVIQGLQPLDPAKVPAYRHVASLPFEPNGNANASYRLGLADAVEVTLPSAPPQTPIRVQTYQCEQNGAPCSASMCPASGIPSSGREIVRNARPRLPLATLASVSGLKFTAPNETAYCVVLCGASGFRVDPQSATWSDLDAIFRGGFACDNATAQQAACASACGETPTTPPPSQTKFTFTLVAAPPRRVQPGDTVSVTILSQFGTGSDEGSRPYTLAHVDSPVDRWGTAFVPGLATAISQDLKETSPVNPTIRQWGDALDQAAFRLKLWSPAQTFAQQAPLDEVALCLSSGWQSTDAATRPPWIKDAIAKCARIGADPAIYVADHQNVSRLRYQLDVIQTWTLVMPDGTAHVRPYEPGRSIGEVADAAIRTLAGTSRRRARRDAYVTVVPAGTLDPKDGSAPFWHAIGRRDRELDRVLLMPGDTVHLTRTRPRPQ